MLAHTLEKIGRGVPLCFEQRYIHRCAHTRFDGAPPKKKFRASAKKFRSSQPCEWKGVQNFHPMVLGCSIGLAFTASSLAPTYPLRLIFFFLFIFGGRDKGAVPAAEI